MHPRLILSLLFLSLAAVINLPAGADAENPAITGDWKLELVGEKERRRGKGEPMELTTVLTFLSQKSGKLSVLASDFPFEILESSYKISSAGTIKIKFECQIRGRKENIDFKGKLSEDGLSILDGKFDLHVASGEFTANRVIE